MSFLNDLPVATLIALAAVVGGIIALAGGDIDFDQFLVGIGAATAGAGVLGEARNRAGKGLHR